MNRTKLILLAALAALAVLIVVLAMRNRQAPFLPADEAHGRFDGAEACLVCHGPDGPSPHDTNHPLGRDCMRCHAFSR